MPQGKGTYGRKVGRPEKKKKAKDHKSFWSKATGGRMK